MQSRSREEAQESYVWKSAGQFSSYYNGNKASLRKTFKTQTEADDKVRDLNRKTEHALDNPCDLVRKVSNRSPKILEKWTKKSTRSLRR